MRKYEPLATFLEAQDGVLPMEFQEIEALVGNLPPSAWKHRSWWGNNLDHVQAVAWMSAGYEVSQVNQEQGRVVFSRSL